MIAFGVLHMAILLILAVASRNLHQASDEVLPKFIEESLLQRILQDRNGTSARTSISLQKQRRRKQLVAQIITDQCDAIAALVMKEMKRGVTLVDGKGM